MFARIYAFAGLFRGVKRDAADRGFGLVFDLFLGLRRAVPMCHDEAAFLDLDLKIVPGVDVMRVFFAKTKGFLINGLLHLFEYYLNGINYGFEVDLYLFECIPAGDLDGAVLNIAHPEGQTYRHAF